MKFRLSVITALLLVLICCCTSLSGQTPPTSTAAPAPVPASPFPQAWAGAGGAWNSTARPQVTGWVSYAVLLSEKGQVYSYTSQDLIPLRVNHLLTIQSSTRTGLATVFKQLGPITILAYGDAGIASIGTVTGGAFAGGGIAVIRLGKTNWTIEAGARLLKSSVGGEQPIYTIGWGRAL